MKIEGASIEQLMDALDNQTFIKRLSIAASEKAFRHERQARMVKNKGRKAEKHMERYKQLMRVHLAVVNVKFYVEI